RRILRALCLGPGLLAFPLQPPFELVELARVRPSEYTGSDRRAALARRRLAVRYEPPHRLDEPLRRELGRSPRRGNPVRRGDIIFELRIERGLVGVEGNYGRAFVYSALHLAEQPPRPSRIPREDQEKRTA